MRIIYISDDGVSFDSQEECEVYEFEKWKEHVTIPVYGKRNKKLDIRKGDETHNEAVKIVIRDEQDLKDIRKLQEWYGYYYGIDSIGTWRYKESGMFICWCKDKDRRSNA